jgi:hypothetical protein
VGWELKIRTNGRRAWAKRAHHQAEGLDGNWQSRTTCQNRRPWQEAPQPYHRDPARLATFLYPGCRQKRVGRPRSLARRADIVHSRPHGGTLGGIRAACRAEAHHPVITDFGFVDTPRLRAAGSQVICSETRDCCVSLACSSDRPRDRRSAVRAFCITSAWHAFSTG